MAAKMDYFGKGATSAMGLELLYIEIEGKNDTKDGVTVNGFQPHIVRTLCMQATYFKFVSSR